MKILKAGPGILSGKKLVSVSHDDLYEHAMDGTLNKDMRVFGVGADNLAVVILASAPCTALSIDILISHGNGITKQCITANKLMEMDLKWFFEKTNDNGVSFHRLLLGEVMRTNYMPYGDDESEDDLVYLPETSAKIQCLEKRFYDISLFELEFDTVPPITITRTYWSKKDTRPQEFRQFMAITGE